MYVHIRRNGLCYRQIYIFNVVCIQVASLLAFPNSIKMISRQQQDPFHSLLLPFLLKKEENI